MTEEEERIIMQLAKADPVYQELLCQCRQSEPDFLRIRGSLNEKDRDILDIYISTCEDMEYCRTCLAMERERNTPTR